MTKVQARVNLVARCPECHLQWAYTNDAKTLSCLNSECSFFGRYFSVPVIHLAEVEQDDKTKSTHELYAEVTDGYEKEVSLANSSVALWIDGSQRWGISASSVKHTVDSVKQDIDAGKIARCDLCDAVPVGCIELSDGILALCGEHLETVRVIGPQPEGIKELLEWTIN